MSDRDAIAVSQPSMDAAKIPDRVRALDDFLQQELLPKVLRLREEHQSIDQQLQRTTTTSTSTTSTTTAKPKQHQAQRLKQQAWLWKRTSKRQELNRIEPFLELANDLQTLSKDLNPNLLRLTQSMMMMMMMDSNSQHPSHVGDRGRLSRDYDTACRENAQLSKSIQARIDRLIPHTNVTSNNNNNHNTEDASIVASLRIFCNSNLVCGTCQAMFHKDYLHALVARAPNDHTTTTATAPTFICFQCCNARGHGKETDDLQVQFGKAFCTKAFAAKPQDKENTNTTNSNNKENNNLPIPPTTSSSQIPKNPMHESERWKARKAVMKNRMVAAAAATATATASKEKSSSRANTDNRSVTTDASTVDDSVKSKDSPSVASQAFDHYIDSMSTLDDGLLRIGKSMSKCSKFVLGDIGKGSRKLPPLLQHLSDAGESATTRTNRLDAMKLQMNSSAVVDVVETNNKDANRTPNENQPNRSWSRYGSSTSSICSNSIVESQASFHSRPFSDASSTTRYTYEMSDGSFVQQIPGKRNEDSWNRVSSPDSSMCSGSSLFSDSSTDASLLTFLTAESSFEPYAGRKFLKSAMKSKKASTIASSTSRASPTKVQDFPFGSSTSSSHSRKSVRFRSPLTECKVFNPMAADNSNKALLDTSAEIMDQIKYFCKWETFLNPFEQKAA